MIIYKNGRIYEIEKVKGETRYEFILRSWYLVNSESTQAESLTWSSWKQKLCSYGIIDDSLVEMTKNYTN